MGRVFRCYFSMIRPVLPLHLGGRWGNSHCVWLREVVAPLLLLFLGALGVLSTPLPQ